MIIAIRNATTKTDGAYARFRERETRRLKSFPLRRAVIHFISIRRERLSAE